MSLLLRHLARYAVRRIASHPRAREKAAQAVRIALDEGKQIVASGDPARAAGQAIRRAKDKLIPGDAPRR